MTTLFYNFLNETNSDYRIKNDTIYINALGFDKSEVKINIEGDYLIIKGEKETPFYKNKLDYKFILKRKTNYENILAKLENGILSINLKFEDEQINKFQIEVN